MDPAESSQASHATWERSFPNVLHDLMSAIDELEAFLTEHQAQPQALYLARLAAEEMGTNIIKYGYDDALQHQISLRAEVFVDHFRLQLLDDGHEFDPLNAPEPDLQLGLEDRTPGGLGICLIRKMARAVHYERRDDWNILTLEVARSEA